MQILYDTGAYTAAVEAYLGGNLAAVEGYYGLMDGLGSYAGMAGDDSTSADFAASYDTAAAQVVAGYADLVEGFATLAMLTQASSGNHQAAERASTLRQVPVCMAPQGTDPVTPMVVNPATPPSCLGHNDTDLPHFWDLVADHLQGLTWPDADTDRLVAAAATWRTANADLDALIRWGLAAVDDLRSQRSPELPVALHATGQLIDIASELGEICGEIADACAEYAAVVTEHRNLVVSIMEQLAVQAGISLALGGIAGFFSGGAGEAAGLAVAGWRVTAAAEKIISALNALRDAARTVAVARLALIIDRLGPLRTTLLKFKLFQDAQEVADVRNLPKLKEFAWDQIVGYKKGKDAMLPIDHIWKMHGPLSNMVGKSRFASGVTREQVHHWAELAARRGAIDPTDGGVIEYDVGTTIGVDSFGAPSRTIRIIIRGGAIHTAFPI